MEATLDGCSLIFYFFFFALAAAWQARAVLLGQGWVPDSTSQSQLADGDGTPNRDSKRSHVPLSQLQAHLQDAEGLEERRHRRAATSIHKDSQTQSLALRSARTEKKRERWSTEVNETSTTLADPPSLSAWGPGLPTPRHKAAAA